MNGLSSKSNQPVSTHRRPGRSKEKRKSKHKLKKRVSSKDRVWVGEVDGKSVCATRPKTGVFVNFRLETEIQQSNAAGSVSGTALAAGLSCWHSFSCLSEQSVFQRGHIPEEPSESVNAPTRLTPQLQMKPMSNRER